MKALKFALASFVFIFSACGQPSAAPTSIAQPAEATQPPVSEAPAVVSSPASAVVETPQSAQPAAVAAVTYGGTAREHVEYITGEIGARWSGTPEESDTAQYVEEEFAALGYEPQVVEFERMGWEDDETQMMFKSANVIAVKAGASAEVIVVGAHYDSSDEGLGADDNASGVGALLELAELVKDVPTPYTIHFVAFGAEEAGMLGSADYVANLSPEEKKNTIGFINMDSIAAGDFTYVYCLEKESALRDWALAWATANGFDLQTIYNVDLSDEGYGSADYEAFQQADIPFAYFEATNWNLGDKDGYAQVDPQYGDEGAIIHTEYDTLEYLDETFPGRVDERLNSVIHIVYALLTEYTMDN